MKLSEAERAANREAFRSMDMGAKLEYILAYYKLPIVIGLIVAIALGSVLYRTITHKDALVYVAFANIVPGEDGEAALTEGFVEHVGENPARCEVGVYRELYISLDDSIQNHQYAYASRLKLMAAIDAEKLDVVIMNREAYDLLSASGYLLDLGSLELDGRLEGLLVSNTVVLSDNRIEVELNEADEYIAETEEQANAIDATSSELFAGFEQGEEIYLGVIGNSPRQERALEYLSYIMDRTA